jgi:hypothetical protein
MIESNQTIMHQQACCKQNGAQYGQLHDWIKQCDHDGQASPLQPAGQPKSAQSDHAIFIMH